MKRFLFPLLATPALGQAIHLSGGESSLMNTEGGGATIYLNNQQIYLGGGRGVGVSDKLDYNHLDFTLGDSIFAYSVDGAGASIFNRGVKVEKTIGDQTIGAFAGLTGLSYQVPFYATMQGARYPGAGIFYKKKHAKWRFASLDEVSRQKTFLQSVAYDGKKISFYANGGLIQNKWQSGATFLFHPSNVFQVIGSHVNQLDYRNDSVSTNLQKDIFTAHSYIIQSEFDGKTVTGEAIGAGIKWKWFQARSDFYSSNGHQQVVNVLIESARHWSLTEAISNANNFQVGGEYHTNKVSVSINHSIQFVPGQGFEQLVSVGIGPHIHDTQGNAQAYMLPGNKFKYTAYSDQWMQGPLNQSAGGPHRQTSIGKYVVQGFVRKQDGTGIEGIALSLNGSILYTDRTGMWTFRSKKQVEAPYQIQLLPDENIAPGEFQVVDESDPLKIVIQQI
jgi:hypothetical protein